MIKIDSVSIERKKGVHSGLGPYVGIFCGKLHSRVWLTIALACGIFVIMAVLDDFSKPRTLFFSQTKNLSICR